MCSCRMRPSEAAAQWRAFTSLSEGASLLAGVVYEPIGKGAEVM